MRQLLITSVSVFLVSFSALTCIKDNIRGQPPRPTPNVAQSTENDPQEVIVATRRNHRLQVFDVDTLGSIGYFAVNNNAEGVTVSPDGQMFFVRQPAPPDINGCCALFALDLKTKKLCNLIEPAGRSVASFDGRWLFTQRGNVGIEVFDANTLLRLPTIEAPGLYALYPSPDNLWLFGITGWQRGSGPSLDMIDLRTRRLARRLPLPNNSGVRGVWVDNHFYLYAHDGRQGNLWKLTSDTLTFGRPMTIALPDLPNNNEPMFQDILAIGDRLFIYEGFGSKLDRRREQGEQISGGIYVIEPSTGKVVAHFVPAFHFAQVVASGDGRWLYGLDSGLTDWRGPVRLVKLDAATGAIITARQLETDVWVMSLAKLPKALIPIDEVQPLPCDRR